MAWIVGTSASEHFGPVAIGGYPVRQDYETTNEDDFIFGGGGFDKICAQGGNDEIFGGDGNDMIDGGWGNDNILGDGPNSPLPLLLLELPGWTSYDDYIRGGYGDDIADGNQGNDTIFGEQGNDKLFGSDGNDVIVGGYEHYDEWPDEELPEEEGPGDEMVMRVEYVEGDSDTIDGGSGDDAIWGGADDDVIAGDDAALDKTDQYEIGGNDTINGESGDDAINGNGGDDVLCGCDGDDSVYGGAGNDVIAGEEGDDCLGGGYGDDCILGGDGYDTLNGWTGDDTMLGGYDNDKLFGGEGYDRLSGGEGDDCISGGQDDDIILGGTGRDKMSGGTGNDSFVFLENEWEGHEGWAYRDVIKDWNEGDQIVYCGQGPEWNWVNKIWFIAADKDGVVNDVSIRFNDNSFVLVKNASWDFSKGYTDLDEDSYINDYGNNIGNFLFLNHDSEEPEDVALVDLYCHIDCEEPECGEAPDPIDFCYDPIMAAA